MFGTHGPAARVRRERKRPAAKGPRCLLCMCVAHICQCQCEMGGGYGSVGLDQSVDCMLSLPHHSTLLTNPAAVEDDEVLFLYFFCVGVCVLRRGVEMPDNERCQYNQHPPPFPLPSSPHPPTHPPILPLLFFRHKRFAEPAEGVAIDSKFSCRLPKGDD
jgi:hypothetical protein